MNDEIFGSVLTLSACLSAVLSALYWRLSAGIKRGSEEPYLTNEDFSSLKISEYKQGILNSLAAKWASVSAACMAVNEVIAFSHMIQGRPFPVWWYFVIAAVSLFFYWKVYHLLWIAKISTSCPWPQDDLFRDKK